MKTIQKIFPDSYTFEISFHMDRVDYSEISGKFTFPVEVFYLKGGKSAGRLALVEYLKGEVSVDVDGMIFYEVAAERIAEEVYRVAEAVNLDAFVACKDEIVKAFEESEMNEGLANFSIDIQEAKELYIDVCETGIEEQEIEVEKEKRDVLKLLDKKKIDKNMLAKVLKTLDLHEEDEDEDEELEEVLDDLEEEDELLYSKYSADDFEEREEEDLTCEDYEDDHDGDDGYCYDEYGDDDYEGEEDIEESLY